MKEKRIHAELILKIPTRFFLSIEEDDEEEEVAHFHSCLLTFIRDDAEKKDLLFHQCCQLYCFMFEIPFTGLY